MISIVQVVSIWYTILHHGIWDNGRSRNLCKLDSGQSPVLGSYRAHPVLCQRNQVIQQEHWKWSLQHRVGNISGPQANSNISHGLPSNHPVEHHRTRDKLLQRLFLWGMRYKIMNVLMSDILGCCDGEPDCHVSADNHVHQHLLIPPRDILH